MNVDRDWLGKIAAARNGYPRPIGQPGRHFDRLEAAGWIVTDAGRRCWLTSAGLRKLGRPRPRTNRPEHTKPTGQR